MGLVKCCGPLGIVNAEKLLEDFLISEEKQLFLLTGNEGFGKTTLVRKKMKLINNKVHFLIFTEIPQKDILKKAIRQFPSDIHVWEISHPDILENQTIQQLLIDISSQKEKFSGKIIIEGENLNKSKNTPFDILMGANIDIENINILDAINNSINKEGLIKKTMTTKPIVYIDMDNVLVDFTSSFDKIHPDLLEQYKNDKDEIPGIFSKMEPMKGSIDAYKYLSKHFDTYILSTAPWKNPTAWSDKLLWVQKYLGEAAHKRLILSHHKNLNRGDYLIDDRPNNGAINFEGKLILFGSEDFPDWKSVIDYMEQKLNNF